MQRKSLGQRSCAYRNNNYLMTRKITHISLSCRDVRFISVWRSYWTRDILLSLERNFLFYWDSMWSQWVGIQRKKIFWLWNNLQSPEHSGFPPLFYIPHATPNYAKSGFPQQFKTSIFLQNSIDSDLFLLFMYLNDSNQYNIAINNIIVINVIWSWYLILAKFHVNYKSKEWFGIA